MKWRVIWQIPLWTGNTCLLWDTLKNCSLCSQAGPSRTSEIDEKIAPGKSYTGRSFAFLASVLEIQCVSFAFHSFATWFAVKLRVLELKHE